MNFSDPIVNPWQGEVVLAKLTLNRFLIFVNGEHWDIVEILLMFIMDCLVRYEGVTKIEYIKKNSKLYNHVKDCMTQFTTYFMTTMITVTEDSTKTV